MSGPLAATHGTTTLGRDTYIVLEVASAAWLDRVYALRRRYDQARVNYPVEVTVVGSSGVGPLAACNGSARTLELVSSVAAAAPAFEARFTAVRHFPGTGIYWLAPQPEPFLTLHAAFAHCGLEFIPTAFPYIPHCTLADLGPKPSDEAVQAVMAFALPGCTTRFSELALYVFGDDGLPFRTHSFALGTGTGAVSRSTLRERPSSRLLVLDPAGRVLLFRFVHQTGPLAGKDFWATPGGALDAGETFEVAAVRELKEETGLEVTDPGVQVARREFVMQLPDGEHVLAEERYFVIRTSGLAVSNAGWTELETQIVGAHKWWSVAELEHTNETVWPSDLAVMLRSLHLQGGAGRVQGEP